MQTAALQPFGQEVEGIDISTLTIEQSDELRRLISRERVVVFRDQRIGDAGLIRFLQGLGDLMFTEGETPVRDAPQLNVVSNIGRLTPPKSVFHTDTSYVGCPPAYTALRPVLLPHIGGATVFSDQVEVAKQLSAKARAYLYGRTVLHRVSGLENHHEATRHPLFRRHPLTGETALYLSTPVRCVALSDTDERTSERIINALYYRSVRSSALYRHEWRAGDVLVWDNRVTMHRADHGGVTDDRIMHRGMVRGETPIAA